MTAKQPDRAQEDRRFDGWLWPTALIMAMGGLGQAVWMWDHTPPDGLAPLWLLLWIGLGVAGLSLPLYWLARRWWPLNWIGLGAWLAVPAVRRMAADFNPGAPSGDLGLVNISPLLLLLVLGIGLSGVILTLSWIIDRRSAAVPPKIRPLRQGFWAGLFVVVCGWLLINRAFAVVSVGLLAGALILLEAFLVMRESSG